MFNQLNAKVPLRNEATMKLLEPLDLIVSCFVKNNIKILIPQMKQYLKQMAVCGQRTFQLNVERDNLWESAKT
jgi:hypothetical protein